MRCTEVRPAGTQLWHKNTLGGGGTKAAYCSTLAVYIYDVAETPKLEKILTGPDKTICSIAWSPTDPNTLAMAVADDDNNIVMWDLAAEVETKRLAASGKAPPGDACPVRLPCGPSQRLGHRGSASAVPAGWRLVPTQHRA